MHCIACIVSVGCCSRPICVRAVLR